MVGPFFELAGRSVSRQRTFRQVVAAHQGVIAAIFLYGIVFRDRHFEAYLGHTLLILGVIEGAVLIGWRLAQWPKSQAMELLLVTSLSPASVLVGEMLVGLAFLGLVMLSGLPGFAVAAAFGWTPAEHLLAMQVLAYCFGSLIGIGLAWWSYEPAKVRVWGERLAGAMLVVYLVVGGLAGEHTFRWLMLVPGGWGLWLRDALWWMHANTPFALVHRLAHGSFEPPGLAWIRMEVMLMAMSGILATRAALRLKDHYVDRHYGPRLETDSRRRDAIGDRPLSWWAVRRVSEFSGRINLYLALGASVLYATYLVVGDRWPTWLGNHIFLVFERMGGIAGLSTGLVVLAAVPAAYQFGLWESSTAARCKRLEVLLLAPFAPLDYLRASGKAAWCRGRGYFLAAAILWLAGWLSGRLSLSHAALAVAAGASVWLVFFSVGFFFLGQTRGATAVGFFLSVLLPALLLGLAHTPWAIAAMWLPPGTVYAAASGVPWDAIAAGTAVALALAAALLAWSLCTFDGHLRSWYNRHAGAK